MSILATILYIVLCFFIVGLVFGLGMLYAFNLLFGSFRKQGCRWF